MEERKPPEERACDEISKQLTDAGWPRLRKGTSGSTGFKREVTVQSGRADFVLYIDGTPVAILEAKKKGTSIIGALDQAERYAKGLNQELGSTDETVQFLFGADGEKLRIRDRRPQSPPERDIAVMHTPEGIEKMLSVDYTDACEKLESNPVTETDRKLWTHQTECVKAIEDNWAKRKYKTLIQMATGAGKTRMATTHVYRLLKYGFVRRVLFIPDTRHLANQAYGDFTSYKTPTGATFDDEYIITNLDDDVEYEDAHVVITTLQKMYELLRRETRKLESHEFDLIITDECHRSIYDNEGYGAVLERFDAWELGLTATPSEYTIRRYGEPVYEYKYLDAVQQNYLVPYVLRQIETQITMNGVVDPQSGTEYPPSDLGTKVNVPDTYRKIAEQLKDEGKIEELTLVFAKNIAQVESIVKSFKEVYSEEGDDFVSAITSDVRDSDRLLGDFSDPYKNPKIAVTVDMVTTGIDIKPLRNIVLFRPVKSPVLYNQMMGRGTRTYTGKDSFTIYDCVGASDYFSELGQPPFDTSTYTGTSFSSGGGGTRQRDGPIIIDVGDIVVGKVTKFPTTDGQLVSDSVYVDRFETFVNQRSFNCLNRITNPEVTTRPNDIREAEKVLKTTPEQFTEAKLRIAYGQSEADLVDFIRGCNDPGGPPSRTDRIEAAFEKYIRTSASSEAQSWLRLLRDEFYNWGDSVDKSDFTRPPLSKYGGWKGICTTFEGAEKVEELLYNIEVETLNH
jgi:type I restriction enzyme R subunit